MVPTIDYDAKRAEGVLDFGKVISFDLDGVILKYDGWQGPDKFGSVIPGAVETMKRLRREGWYITIFTTRLVTTKLVDYLFNLGVPYDDINGRVVPMDGASREVTRLRVHTIAFQEYGGAEVNYGSVCDPVHYWAHNPPWASIKPFASVYVDDMNWENEGRNFDESTWMKLNESLKRRFPVRKITEVEDGD
jgi:hypothetical protein